MSSKLSQVSTALSSVSTPLVIPAWRQALSTHPDQALARYIISGLQNGFRIGFKYGSPLRSSPKNMLSAIQHPEVITSYLQTELSLNRMLGPFTEEAILDWPLLHTNRYGVIPKGHNTGKWIIAVQLNT